jgi:hypothetical protein
MIWFKWYIDCLQDYSFMELSEKDRWIFLGLMCLAGRTNNKVNNDEKWLERTLNTTDIKNSIDILKDKGLIAIIYTDDSKSLLTIDKIREDKIREETLSDNKDNKEYLDLCNLLKELMLKNNPKANIKQKNWYDEVRKMIEIDKRTIQEIKEVIEWCQNDEFWHKNILSMSKLREKFDRLWLAKQDKKPKSLTERERSLHYDVKKRPINL